MRKTLLKLSLFAFVAGAVSPSASFALTCLDLFRSTETKKAEAVENTWTRFADFRQTGILENAKIKSISNLLRTLSIDDLYHPHPTAVAELISVLLPEGQILAENGNIKSLFVIGIVDTIGLHAINIAGDSGRMLSDRTFQLLMPSRDLQIERKITRNNSGAKDGEQLVIRGTEMIDGTSTHRSRSLTFGFRRMPETDLLELKYLTVNIGRKKGGFMNLGGWGLGPRSSWNFEFHPTIVSKNAEEKSYGIWYLPEISR